MDSYSDDESNPPPDRNDRDLKTPPCSSMKCSSVPGNDVSPPKILINDIEADKFEEDVERKKLQSANIELERDNPQWMQSQLTNIQLQRENIQRMQTQSTNMKLEWENLQKKQAQSTNIQLERENLQKKQLQLANIKLERENLQLKNAINNVRLLFAAANSNNRADVPPANPMGEFRSLSSLVQAADQFSALLKSQGSLQGPHLGPPDFFNRMKTAEHGAAGLSDTSTGSSGSYRRRHPSCYSPSNDSDMQYFSDSTDLPPLGSPTSSIPEKEPPAADSLPLESSSYFGDISTFASDTVSNGRKKLLRSSRGKNRSSNGKDRFIKSPPGDNWSTRINRPGANSSPSHTDAETPTPNKESIVKESDALNNKQPSVTRRGKKSKKSRRNNRRSMTKQRNSCMDPRTVTSDLGEKQVSTVTDRVDGRTDKPPSKVLGAGDGAYLRAMESGIRRMSLDANSPTKVADSDSRMNVDPSESDGYLEYLSSSDASIKQILYTKTKYDRRGTYDVEPGKVILNTNLIDAGNMSQNYKPGTVVLDIKAVSNYSKNIPENQLSIPTSNDDEDLSDSPDKLIGNLKLSSGEEIPLSDVPNQALDATSDKSMDMSTASKESKVSQLDKSNLESSSEKLNFPNSKSKKMSTIETEKKTLTLACNDEKNEQFDNPKENIPDCKSSDSSQIAVGRKLITNNGTEDKLDSRNTTEENVPSTRNSSDCESSSFDQNVEERNKVPDNGKDGLDSRSTPDKNMPSTSNPNEKSVDSTSIDSESMLSTIDPENRIPHSRLGDEENILPDSEVKQKISDEENIQPDSEVKQKISDEENIQPDNEVKRKISGSISNEENIPPNDLSLQDLKPHCMDDLVDKVESPEREIGPLTELDYGEWMDRLKSHSCNRPSPRKKNTTCRSEESSDDANDQENKTPENKSGKRKKDRKSGDLVEPESKRPSSD